MPKAAYGAMQDTEDFHQRHIRTGALWVPGAEHHWCVAVGLFI